MKGHDSGRFFKSAPGQPGGTNQIPNGQRASADDSMDGQPPTDQEQPPPPNFAAAAPQAASPQLTAAGQSPVYQQVASPSSPGQPQRVIDTGNLLRANGIAITPRTVYLSHVLGPEAAVDLIKRTGSTSSPDVPSPDAATGDQMRAWVRALRLGPAAAGIAGGMAPAPNAGPATADQPSADAFNPTQSFG